MNKLERFAPKNISSLVKQVWKRSGDGTKEYSTLSGSNISKLKILSRDKHSSLFIQSVNIKEKGFVGLTAWPNDIKLFTVVIFDCW
jgi:hypothetical protein